MVRGGGCAAGSARLSWSSAGSVTTTCSMRSPGTLPPSGAASGRTDQARARARVHGRQHHRGPMRAGAPRRGELLALSAGLATFVYVGWDGALWDARYQLLLHLFGLGAAAGLALMAWRGAALPRTRIDIPILLVVAAFGLAALTAQNTGLAARALASIVAFACMLPVALVALASTAPVGGLRGDRTDPRLLGGDAVGDGVAPHRLARRRRSDDHPADPHRGRGRSVPARSRPRRSCCSPPRR